MIYQVAPNQIFEQQSKNGVCPVKSATVALGVANNQTVVAAVTAKSILVLGLIAFSNTGSFNFKNGSGGAVLLYGPITTANPVFTLPLHEFGYFETSVGVGLFVDIATAATNITVRYIEYIP